MGRSAYGSLSQQRRVYEMDLPLLLRLGNHHASGCCGLYVPCQHASESRMVVSPAPPQCLTAMATYSQEYGTPLIQAPPIPPACFLGECFDNVLVHTKETA